MMERTDSNLITGNIAMLTYAVITALSSIFIHTATQSITPLLSAFNTFLFCLVGYTLLSVNTFYKMELIKKNIYSIFMLNITTAICWVFTFLSLKYLPPELYLFTYLCAMPISAAVLFRSHVFKAVVLLCGLVILAYTYHNIHLLLGLMLAFMGGTSGTIYSIYSKRITSVFSTVEILSLRFYLTVVATFILSYMLGDWRILTFIDYGKFAALAIVSVMIPLTLFQVGLKNLNITKALAYMPLAPLACYFISLILGYDHFNILQFCAIFLLCMAMIGIRG